MAQRLMGVLGLAVLLGIAVALSKDRRRIPVRTVLWGLGLQVAFALVILKTWPGRAFFKGVETVFKQIIAFTDAGSDFVFANWGVPVQLAKAGTGQAHEFGFALAFRMLPVLIFFASLMGILYHLGVMPLRRF